MGRGSDGQMANKYIWKMLIINHREIQSKLQWGITSYLLEEILSKRQEINGGEDVEKKKYLSFFHGNINWSSYYGGQYKDFPKYLK